MEIKIKKSAEPKCIECKNINWIHWCHHKQRYVDPTDCCEDWQPKENKNENI